MTLEVNCVEDVDKYGETRVVKNLILHPMWKWDSKTGMFVYDNAVIFNFNELGRTSIEGHCLLLRLLWTLPSARKKGKTLEALKSLMEVCDLSRCAVVAMISPFKPRRKIYDIGLALNRLKLNQFDVIDKDKATVEIEGMRRLLRRAGFKQGDFHGVIAFGDPNFPSDRQFVYVPPTIDDFIGGLINFRIPERMLALFEDDLDAA